jgi:hypothetical protein
MDQTASDVKTEAKKPKNQKHNNNRPKHVCSPLFICKSSSLALAALSASKRLSALQTKSSGSRRNQSAERTHPLRPEILGCGFNARNREEIEDGRQSFTQTTAEPTEGHRFASAPS